MKLNLLVGISLVIVAVNARTTQHMAPVFSANDDISALALPNEYIVRLKEPEASNEFNFRREQSARDMYVRDHLDKLFGSSLLDSQNIIHVYNLGYAALMDQTTIGQLRLNKDVEFIEPNQVVWASHDMLTQQDPPNWGLDRISRRELPLEHEYSYSSTAGQGVEVYVIDTGINVDHNDFEGRAVWGLTAPRGDEDRDGNGHGTHVSSTIAGALHGVAKNATVIAVKVLRSSGYGTTADVLKGIEWAANEHQRKSRESKDGKPVKSVANMSLGGGKSVALDMAVESAVTSGVLFAVAAGNDNRDACDYSPAGAASAITVGATDRYDVRAWFSNWGSCVDIFAPGHEITAAWKDTKDGVKTISGTSMASPHVAGVMALIAADGDYTPSELKAKVLVLASKDKISNPGSQSPNLLLFAEDSIVEEVPPTVASEVFSKLRFQLSW